MIPFCVLTLNHHQAPVEVRERVAFAAAAQPEALARLVARPGIAEGMILSTCNRVEVWTVLVNGQEQQGEAELRRFFCERNGLDERQLAPYLTLRLEEQAVRHIFRVACSLDSMIVGEPQILGQVKDAAGVAAEARSTGTLLGKCLERAFKVAKRVRSETRLGEAAINVSSAAVELAKKIFGELGSRTVLLLGAGEMAELAARHLHSAGAARIVVANRSVERAVALAEQIQGHAIPLAELDDHLWEADIVIGSTGSPQTLVGPAQVSRAMKRRKNRSMLFVDIAVPRDIAVEVGRLDNVFLYDIDDLHQVVQANLHERTQEAAVAETIVAAELESFVAWQKSLNVVPVIVSLRNTLQAIQEEEVQRTMRRLGHLDEKDRQAVEAMARAIVNKILHAPLTELKRAGSDGDGGADLAQAASKLFKLEDGQVEAGARPPLAGPEPPASDPR